MPKPEPIVLDQVSADVLCHTQTLDDLLDNVLNLITAFGGHHIVKFSPTKIDATVVLVEKYPNEWQERFK